MKILLPLLVQQSNDQNSFCHTVFAEEVILGCATAEKSILGLSAAMCSHFGSIDA
jgi:hypothetical protein